MKTGKFVTSFCGINKDSLWLLYLLMFTSKNLTLRNQQQCREELRDGFNSAKLPRRGFFHLTYVKFAQ